MYSVITWPHSLLYFPLNLEKIGQENIDGKHQYAGKLSHIYLPRAESVHIFKLLAFKCARGR